MACTPRSPFSSPCVVTRRRLPPEAAAQHEVVVAAEGEDRWVTCIGSSWSGTDPCKISGRGLGVDEETQHSREQTMLILRPLRPGGRETVPMGANPPGVACALHDPAPLIPDVL